MWANRIVAQGVDKFFTSQEAMAVITKFFTRKWYKSAQASQKINLRMSKYYDYQLIGFALTALEAWELAKNQHAKELR